MTIFFVVSGGPFTTEQVVGKSGPLIGLALLLFIPVVWALPVGLMTAELSSAFPEEGGYYVWVRHGAGKFAAFLCAWWSWLSSWVDLALYPLIAVTYACRMVGNVSPQLQYSLVVGCIVAITILNLVGIRAVSEASTAIFLVMTVPLLLVVGIAIFRGFNSPLPHLPWSNPNVEFKGYATATVYALWNYFGWDSLTAASGEVESSSKTFPRAIILAMFLTVASIVIPVMAGIVLKTDWQNWDTDKGYWPEIAAAAWQPLWYGMIVAGTVSNLGLFAANMLASSRIPYVLSGEGYLPGWLYTEHPRYKTPWVTILIAAVMCAMLARDSFENLVGVDLALYLAALCLEIWSWIALRRSRKLDYAPFRVRGGLGGVLILSAFPVVIAVGALVIQLSPSIGVVDTTMFHVAPWQLLLLMLATGPLVYLVSRLFQIKGLPAER